MQNIVKDISDKLKRIQDNNNIKLIKGVKVKRVINRSEIIKL